MGLLTILKKVKQRERELRILILGLDNAGKTTGEFCYRSNGQVLMDSLCSKESPLSMHQGNTPLIFKTWIYITSPCFCSDEESFWWEYSRDITDSWLQYQKVWRVSFLLVGYRNRLISFVDEIPAFSPFSLQFEYSSLFINQLLLSFLLTFSSSLSLTIYLHLLFYSYSLEYKEYILNLWDVGGQKSIRTYWRNYFELTDGIIWVRI